MCTPQLRNQAATLKGGTYPTSAVSTSEGTLPTADPMRRRLLALAALSGNRSAVSSVPSPGAGAPPDTGVGLRPANLASPATDAGRFMSRSSVAGPSALPGIATQPAVATQIARPTMIDTLAAGNTAPVPKTAPARTRKPVSFTPEEADSPSVETILRARDAVRKRDPLDPPVADARPFLPSYRTSNGDRAFLTSVERVRKPAPPYPSGSPGSAQFGAQDREAMRIWVGYLYTLPEVKAMLDVYSTTEGADAAGYYRGHYGGPGDFQAGELNSYPGMKIGPDGPIAVKGYPPVGRYQIEPTMYQEYGSSIYSRTDFRPVTQDLIAITAMVRDRVIDKLLAGDIRGAFSRASRTFASIPMSAARNFSGFGNDGKPHFNDNIPVGDRQPAANFDDLPTLFQARLGTRRAEMDRARRDWETKHIIPYAFIDPTRWRQFGRSDF